ncbi:hypothetical protein [uncultured Streptomyces sp.]|uniref:hypothetical protein n=1 Tax=uncultured Streptomyces sp. TaxID=174707 RepID=UPI0026391450|nr:hypothetical protein [uncultured Streptomyces sp.]
MIARSLRRCAALDAYARADLDYLHGRISMALDLGHRRTAHHEPARLRELETEVRARHAGPEAADPA